MSHHLLGGEDIEKKRVRIFAKLNLKVGRVGRTKLAPEVLKILSSTFLRFGRLRKVPPECAELQHSYCEQC